MLLKKFSSPLFWFSRQKTGHTPLIKTAWNAFKELGCFNVEAMVRFLFLLVLIFVASGHTTNIAKICTKRKFPAIRYVGMVMWDGGNLLCL